MTDENISDAAVQKATGADWGRWFERLDEAGAMDMDHAGIAKHIATAYDVSGWWSQMVTVQYERARGLRQVNQASSGWQFSKQKTLAMTPAKAFQAMLGLPGWHDLEEGQERDLGFGPVTVRRVDQDLIRLWVHAEGRSVLEIAFTPADQKTAVRFTHSQIPDEAALPAWKERWVAVLASLG